MGVQEGLRFPESIYVARLQLLNLAAGQIAKPGNWDPPHCLKTVLANNCCRSCLPDLPIYHSRQQWFPRERQNTHKRMQATGVINTTKYEKEKPYLAG